MLYRGVPTKNNVFRICGPRFSDNPVDVHESGWFRLRLGPRGICSQCPAPNSNISQMLHGAGI